MGVENVHILKSQIFFQFNFTKIFRMYNTFPSIYILLFALNKAKRSEFVAEKESNPVKYAT
jgi:hypothetical protein